MYHVIGTATAVSALYFISYIFCRAGIYSKATHRKVWNSVLALTFIFTALAGLFLALQINYKWDIPGIKSLLKWHVETGAGMAITGIFHLAWHLSYFKTIFRSGEAASEQAGFIKMSPGDTGINLFIIGFTSMSVQILLMREIMNISGGYELTAGIYLGSWLITSGIGAYTAGKSAMKDIPLINLMFSVSPLLSLGLLILFTRLFLETGETPSFLSGMILTFLVLAPFCIISGFSLVRLMAAARTGNGFIPGKSFSIETIGGITAGLLLTVLTAGVAGTYKIIFIIILLTAAYVVLKFYLTRKKIRTVARIATAGLAAFIIISDPDVFFRDILLPGINVTSTADTPYGNITFGNYSGEVSVYYNQRLLAYPDDVIEREENIHYGLLQRENPGKVLLISGSLNSHLPEVLKYPVRSVYFLERDPGLIKTVASDSDPSGIELVKGNKDAFRYLKSCREEFDAVFLLLPPPSTFSLNRYYTTEFFKNVRESLTSDGVFVCSPGVWDNYPNDESLRLFSSVYNGLKDAFSYVKPIAGNKLYFVASPAEVSASVCKLSEERKISNIYVGCDYIVDDLIETKSDEIISRLDTGIRKNSSLFPVAAFHSQTYNMSRDINERLPSLIFLIMVFAILLISVRRRNLIMYCSASSLAGFEIIILLLLQLTAGNMYQYSGIILATLMAGLAAGAGMNIRFLNSLDIKIKAFSLALYYAIIALITGFIISISSVPAIALLLLFTLIPSIITGHIFRVLTAADSDGSVTAVTYYSDLTGSAFGFMVISGIAVPVAGLKVSIFLLSGIIFAGILLATNRNKY